MSEKKKKYFQKVRNKSGCENLKENNTYRNNVNQSIHTYLI